MDGGVAEGGKTPHSQSADSCTACCSKRHRDGEPSELSATAFRAVEKRYKLFQLPRRQARRHSIDETDFTDVVDFHDLGRNTAVNRARIQAVRVEDPDVSCYTFAGVPGLLLFANVLSEAEQIQWCREAILNFGDSSQHPNILSTHAKQPRATTCYQPPMRWSTLGFSYAWTSKTYSRTHYSAFPAALRARMESLIGLVARTDQDQWRHRDPALYEPQTAIVNYYPVGSMMMCHQDVSEEVLDQALVSASIGCSAVFLMGTDSRNDAPYAFFLRSGDVAAFVGPARTAFHSTPRILDDCPPYLTLPDDAMTEQEKASFDNHAYYRHHTADGSFVSVDKTAMSAEEQERYWRLCMRHLRVNINARQVYADRCDFLFA